LGKFFAGFERCSEIGGIWNRGKCIIAFGDGRPAQKEEDVF